MANIAKLLLIENDRARVLYGVVERDRVHILLDNCISKLTQYNRYLILRGINDLVEARLPSED